MVKLHNAVLSAGILITACILACCASTTPLPPEWYCEQGNALAEQDSRQEAVVQYTEAIRLNPEYAEAYINRGVTYFELGQLEQSVRDYNSAIRLNPQFVEAHYNRGYSYYEMGKLELSLRDYSEAIRLNPQFAWAYANRARVYTLFHRDAEAELDINRAIELGCDSSILMLEIEYLKQQR